MQKLRVLKFQTKVIFPLLMLFHNYGIRSTFASSSFYPVTIPSALACSDQRDWSCIITNEATMHCLNDPPESDQFSSSVRMKAHKLFLSAMVSFTYLTLAQLMTPGHFHLGSHPSKGFWLFSLWSSPSLSVVFSGPIQFFLHLICWRVFICFPVSLGSN